MCVSSSVCGQRHPTTGHIAKKRDTCKLLILNTPRAMLYSTSLALLPKNLSGRRVCQLGSTTCTYGKPYFTPWSLAIYCTVAYAYCRLETVELAAKNMVGRAGRQKHGFNRFMHHLIKFIHHFGGISCVKYTCPNSWTQYYLTLAKSCGHNP